MLLLEDRAGTVAQKRDADEGESEAVACALDAACPKLVCVGGYEREQQKGEGLR
jgi:predicted nucleic acid-binding protein